MGEGQYYFVENDTLVHTLLFDNAYQLKYLKNKKESKNYWRDFGYEHFGREKDFLIESRFNEIRSILWRKLWENLFYKKSKQYSIKIFYNEKYGYPMMIRYLLHDNKGNIIPEQGVSCISSSSWHISSLRLIMLTEETRYDKEILQKILDKIVTYRKNPYPKTKLVEKRGGNIVEGSVLRAIEWVKWDSSCFKRV